MSDSGPRPTRTTLERRKRAYLSWKSEQDAEARSLDELIKQKKQENNHRQQESSNDQQKITEYTRKIQQRQQKIDFRQRESQQQQQEIDQMQHKLAEKMRKIEEVTRENKRMDDEEAEVCLLMVLPSRINLITYLSGSLGDALHATLELLQRIPLFYIQSGPIELTIIWDSSARCSDCQSGLRV